MKSILMRAFGRPKGVLGKIGGTIMARVNQKIAHEAIELLDVKPSDSVLEIGFGPGIGIQLLAAKVTLGRVAGVDYSVEMVKQAKVRNASAIEAGKVELHPGSVQSLAFDNDTFDKALSINSMQTWPDALAGLREIRRVIKPGGRVVLGFTRHSGQPKRGVTGLLAEAGFLYASLVDVDQDFCVYAIKPN